MIASIILVFYFLGLLSKDIAIVCLYLSGILLFIAEFGIISLGLLSVNALLAIYAGFALQTGHTMFMGVDVGWSLLFGISFIEFGLLFIAIWAWKKNKRIVPATGTDAMIGKKAEIVEWNGKNGKISYEGEVWKAISEKNMDFAIGEKITIKSIEKLTVIITN